MSVSIEEAVIVHPTVLLGIVDHFGHDSRDRVMGVILGNKINNEFHITNSYALPFEEQIENEGKENETGSWYFDTTYQNTMFGLVKKINSHEEVLGWYHTGSENINDIEITNCFKRLVTYKNSQSVNHVNKKLNILPPFMLVVNVKENNKSNPYPVKVYGVDEDNKFFTIESRIEAEEAEEVGVEHLLREIRDETEGYLKDKLNVIKNSLFSYQMSLRNIINYLDDVVAEKKECNHKILFEIQECLNSIPRITKAKTGNLNEVYVSFLTKNVVKLKDLIKNRAENEGVL